MVVLLVSDTSVLIDLERGGLLDAVFGPPFQVAVPDLLYERELRRSDGPDLTSKDLKILALAPEGVALAQEYRRREPRLSLPDAFALALAKSGGHVLLAGDASLRAQAKIEGVECHGVLWILDALEEHGLVNSSALDGALTRISKHPRCRLPRNEVQKRLERYRRSS